MMTKYSFWGDLVLSGKKGFVEAQLSFIRMLAWYVGVNEQMDTNSLFWATYSPGLVKE